MNMSCLQLPVPGPQRYPTMCETQTSSDIRSATRGTYNYWLCQFYAYTMAGLVMFAITRLIIKKGSIGEGTETYTCTLADN